MKPFDDQGTGQYDVYAFVTGASKGLGREFALELARRKINLLMVALPDDGLPEFCRYLRQQFEIKCHYYETDLTKTTNINEMICWATGNYRINILINTAGMGGSNEFVLAEAEYLESMISLNIKALTLITHQLLPELKTHKQSYILNVASMASFSPIGYKTIYPASKVFVLYFTRGLNQELKGTGVLVSAVHPGPMRTNSLVTKRIDEMGFFGRIGLLTPEYVAARSLNLLFRGRIIIIPGWLNHLTWFGMKAVPVSIRLPFISNLVKKELIASSKKQ